MLKRNQKLVNDVKTQSSAMFQYTLLDFVLAREWGI